jgi:hypothetical protein
VVAADVAGAVVAADVAGAMVGADVAGAMVGAGVAALLHADATMAAAATVAMTRPLNEIDIVFHSSGTLVNSFKRSQRTILLTSLSTALMRASAE